MSDIPDRYSARTQYTEWQAAKKYWGAAAAMAKKIADKAAGDAYAGKEGVATPENYYATHSLYTKARLSSGELVPKFTSRKRDQSERVKRDEDYAAQWIKDTGFGFEFERLIDDMNNGGAVCLVRQGARKGYEQLDDPPHTTTAHRWPIRLWGCDPVASSYEAVRYAYHECIEVQEDLIAIAEANPEEWDVEAVKRMVPEDLSTERGKEITGVNRKEVTYIVMWWPHFTLPEDDPAWKGMSPETREQCHGTIFKFALCKSNGMLSFLRGGSPEFLGPPRPYYGPRQGPYVYAGFLDVPDQIRANAPLISNMGQIEQLNTHERGCDLVEARSKTVFAFDGMQEKDAQTLEDAQHGDAVRLAGLDTSKSMTIDFPGITADKRARGLELAARVRRNLGMPDTALGETTGAATLGENQIADAHLNQISEYMDRRARRLVAQVLLRVVWYAENDSRTVSQYDGNLMLGGRDRDQAVDRAHRAGMISEHERQEMLASLPESAENEQTFEDLELSVERVKQDAQSLQRFQAATEFLTVVAPMAPLFAQLGGEGFQKFMERAAVEYQVDELATVFDMEKAAEMPVPGQEEEPPRTAPAPESPVQRTSPGAKPNPGNKPEKQAVELRKGA